MSEENGKVCCSCRHCERYHDEDGLVTHCECEISKKWLGYVQVMTGWCKNWAKKREGEKQ